jgi:hypothetical protein
LRALADAAGEERYEQLGVDLSEESEELQIKPFTPNQLRAKLGDSTKTSKSSSSTLARD